MPSVNRKAAPPDPSFLLLFHIWRPLRKSEHPKKYQNTPGNEREQRPCGLETRPLDDPPEWHHEKDCDYYQPLYDFKFIHIFTHIYSRLRKSHAGATALQDGWAKGIP